MYEGKPIQLTESPRRRLAVLVARAANRFSGLTPTPSGGRETSTGKYPGAESGFKSHTNSPASSLAIGGQTEVVVA